MAAGAGEQLYPRPDDKWSGSRLRLWLTAVSFVEASTIPTNPPPRMSHPAEKSLAWAPPRLLATVFPLPAHLVRAMLLLAGPNLWSLSWHPTAIVKSREFIEVVPGLSNYSPVTNSMANLESISQQRKCDLLYNNRKIRNRLDNNPFKEKNLPFLPTISYTFLYNF